MANVTINLESAPSSLPSGVELNTGSWYYNGYYLKSNSISDNDQTSGYIKFEAIVGTVSAVIGVSSEASCDIMSLYLSKYSTPPSRGGGNMANISGTYDNQSYNYSITSAGTYYLHFSYAKDGSVSKNADCGWIRSVTLPMIDGDCYTNVNGVWKRGTTYTNVNGVWKQGVRYVNVNGIWKQGQ